MKKITFLLITLFFTVYAYSKNLNTSVLNKEIASSYETRSAVNAVNIFDTTSIETLNSLESEILNIEITNTDLNSEVDITAVTCTGPTVGSTITFEAGSARVLTGASTNPSVTNIDDHCLGVSAVTSGDITNITVNNTFAGISGLGDLAVIMTAAGTTVTSFSYKSDDSSNNFSVTSFDFGFAAGSATSITVQGYDDGVATSGTIIKAGSAGLNYLVVSAGDISGSTGWDNIDEIRMTPTAPIASNWAIDDVLLAASVDNTPPVFESSTPSASSIASTGFTLETDIDEAGSIFYVVVADAATAPTSTEVVAGTGSGGTGQITSGNAAVSTGGFTNNFSVTGLTQSTAYDVYVVAQDDEGTPNLQTSPTMIDVTSAGPVNWTGATDSNWTTTTNWSTNAVPGALDNVIIPAALTNYPTASAAVTVNAVTMNSGTMAQTPATLIAQSTFAGTVTYNRNLATTNWYLVGSPVGGETIEDLITNHTFATGSAPNIGLAPYDNSQASANDRWDYQTAASTGSLTLGGGYSVKLNAAGDISFSGTMPVADVGVSITSNVNSQNLVGNPYPSFLAANTNAHATNNLLTVNTSSLTENTIWLWDQGTSSYDQINQASAAFHVAPGQGFFVSSTGSNTFNFTEAMQSHQSTDSFQRDGTARPEVILTITDGTNTRDADIYYIDGTTTGWDNGFDSSIFNGVANSFAIYTHAVADGSGRNLGIQSLPNADLESMIIPVGVNATSGTDINISALATHLPAGLNVYLEDKNDGSFTLLNDTSEFSTTLTSDLSGIGRFYIHTTSSALSVDDLNLDHLSVYTSDRNNLRIVGIQNGRAKVNMYNILGKQVLTTSFQGNGANDVSLPNLRAGIYIVQLETENGTLNTKLIIE